MVVPRRPKARDPAPTDQERPPAPTTPRPSAGPAVEPPSHATLSVRTGVGRAFATANGEGGRAGRAGQRQHTEGDQVIVTDVGRTTEAGVGKPRGTTPVPVARMRRPGGAGRTRTDPPPAPAAVPPAPVVPDTGGRAA